MTVLCGRVDVDMGVCLGRQLLELVRSGSNGAGTLVDILTLQLVKGSGQSYGSQRLWTAVAWGVGSWGAGQVRNPGAFRN